MKPFPAYERKFLASCTLSLQPQLAKCYFEVWEADGLIQLWVYHQALPNPQFQAWRKALRQYAAGIGIRSLKFVRASDAIARLKCSKRWSSSAKKSELSRVARLGGEA